MNGNILLDTSIVIPFFNNDISIREKLSKAQNVFVPFVVIGELYYGAYKSFRTIENIRRIDIFVNDSVVLSYSTEVAREYGKLKTELKNQGSPIPENDIWIGAVARHFNLTLATRDQHFSQIKLLKTEYW